MKKILVYVGRKKSWASKLSKFSDSLKRYIGKFKKDITYGKNYERLDLRSYDFLITLGIDGIEDKKNLFDPFLNNNKNIAVLGSGLFFKDKLTNMCCHIDGTHYTNFGNKYYDIDLDEKRLKKFFVDSFLYKPWKKDQRSKIVIAHYLTKTWDNLDKEPFYSSVYEKCLGSRFETIFRKQPKQKYDKKIIDKIKDFGFKIEEANLDISNLKRSVENCHCLISYGGKVACKYIIFGIPSITYGPNMAETVSERDLGKICNPKMPDRSKWFKWLSYCHWYINEIEDGTMWKFYLDKGLIKI